MRKLSKKISMLMVLAMLVSLFSGVVSASAASSWSFFNKTKEDSIVAQSKTETYKMENNEFADFDMFKDGKTIDTKVYTVKYGSSDADVVFVDAKNGKLRAKGEAGESAKVTAYITNKNTGAKAQRWFVIEIVDGTDYDIVADFADEVVAVGEKLALAATVTADGEAVEAKVAFTLDGATITEFVATEADEYTIVATATIDGEVVATEKFVVVAEENAPEIVTIKQVSLDTVAITFANAAWAKKAADDASLIKASYQAGTLSITDYVKSVAVAEDDAKTILVTLYNGLAEEVIYTFAYAGFDCSASIVGADSKPAKIEVVGGKIPLLTTGDSAKLKVKVYNSIGVDVTAKGNYFVTYTSSDYTLCNVNGDEIYFFEAGKTVIVTAELEMGYDENGNKINNLKATGAYTSVAQFTDAATHQYKIDSAAGNSWVPYQANNLSDIAVGDTTKYLHAQFNRTWADGRVQVMTIKGGLLYNPDNTVAAGTYTYYSSNEAVALVEVNNGWIKPGSAGTTSIFIKDANGSVVGSVVVTVAPNRTITNFSASPVQSKVSFGGAVGTTEKIGIALKASDQLGAGVGATYKVELATPAGGNLSDYLVVATGSGTVNALVREAGTDKVYFNPAGNVTKIANGNVANITLKFTATDYALGYPVEKVQYVNVSIKNVNGVAVARYAMNLSTNAVDMKLTKDNASDYDVNVSVDSVDAAGYVLEHHAMSMLTDKNTVTTAVTGNNAFSVLITKDNNVFTNWDAATGKITPVTVTGGTTVVKLDKGNYVISLYRGNGVQAGQVTQATLVLSDSTPAMTAKATTSKIVNFADADVMGALKFYRNGSEIYTVNGIDTNYAVVTTAGNEVRYYVQKLDVMVKADEFNGNWASKLIKETVNVGQLFTH